MDIVERFINYTKINTTTSRENGAKGIMPSSPGQMKLAKLLVSELEALGMEDIILRENAIVTATLPANTDETIPVVSFFGHLDTSAEQTADTKAQRLPYNGGDLCLNPELNIYLRESEFPELKNYIGDDLIVTDGNRAEMSPEAAGIAACLMTYSHHACRTENYAMTVHYYRLRDYALQHPECSAIMRIID